MKVLIVDDEELDLFISRKLIGTEFEVEGFTTIGDAAAWANENDFDIALIDYYLGGSVYATDALNALRTLEGKKFKAYVVSNYVDDKQIKQLKEAGFNDVIYKPLTLDTLKSKLG